MPGTSLSTTMETKGGTKPKGLAPKVAAALKAAESKWISASTGNGARIFGQKEYPRRRTPV